MPRNDLVDVPSSCHDPAIGDAVELTDHMKRASDGIVVRRFEADDADVVAAMAKELAILHGEDASATTSDLIRYTLPPEPISAVWIVLLDGEPSGFAATYDWMNYIRGFPVRVIDLFHIRENARRCGLGRFLLMAIARDAGASGCRRITVGAEPDNEAANAFYQTMGFELRISGSNRYVASGTALDRLTIA